MRRLSPFLATRGGKLAAAALVVALALRIAVIAANPLPPLSHDPLDYHNHAVSIAHGHGYPPSHYAPGGGPSAFRPPGYPYFLAGVYVLSGDSIDAARVVQALLGTLTVALIGFIALRLFGPRPAMVALWLAAVYPPLVLSSFTLISEAVFLPLVLGALALALHLRGSPRLGWRGAAAVGLLVGLAVLVRSVSAVLLLPLAIPLMGRGPSGGWRRLKLPAIMALATLLTVTPWLVRNVVVMHKLIYSTETFYFLAATFNDVSKRDQTFPAATHPFALPQYEPTGF